LEIRYPLGAQQLFDHPVHVAEISSLQMQELKCASAVV
jgi:hypothetical protein